MIRDEEMKTKPGKRLNLLRTKVRTCDGVELRAAEIRRIVRSIDFKKLRAAIKATGTWMEWRVYKRRSGKRKWVRKVPSVSVLRGNLEWLLNGCCIANRQHAFGTTQRCGGFIVEYGRCGRAVSIRIEFSILCFGYLLVDKYKPCKVSHIEIDLPERKGTEMSTLNEAADSPVRSKREWITFFGIMAELPPGSEVASLYRGRVYPPPRRKREIPILRLLSRIGTLHYACDSASSIEAFAATCACRWTDAFETSVEVAQKSHASVQMGVWNKIRLRAVARQPGERRTFAALWEANDRKRTMYSLEQRLRLGHGPFG